MEKPKRTLWPTQYLLSHKEDENEILPFVTTWMDLVGIMLSEIRQRKTNITRHHSYVESKKMIQMNLFTKQKQTNRYRKQTYGYQRGKGRGRDKLGVWD